MVKEDALKFVYLKLVLTAAFWGGTFIAGRILAANLGPFSAAFLRFAIASLVLAVVAWKLEGRLHFPKRRQLLPIFLLGLTGVFLYNFFFFTGLRYVEAGRASVIVANNPIFIALFSAYFYKERLTPLKTLGILLSVTGALIVITKGDLLALFAGGFGIGEMFILGCVASWVAYSLIGKAMLRSLSPLLSVAYSVFAGTVLLLAPALIEGVGTSIRTNSFLEWLSLAYLGVFGTVIAFIWYNQGIERIGPSRAGLFINFVPISGVLLGFLLLGEAITVSLLVGLVFVSTGVYLNNRKPAPALALERQE